MVSTGDDTAITQSIDVHKFSEKYPLRKGHYLWLLLHALLGPYYKAQKFALYLLFVQTASGCDFKHDLVLMHIITICCESLVIPLTGYISDRFKTWNHYILGTTFTLNFILSLILYIVFLGEWSSSQRLLVAINIAQSLIKMQFHNSLYKLTKLYIDYDTTLIDCTLDTLPKEGVLNMLCINMLIDTDTMNHFEH